MTVFNINEQAARSLRADPLPSPASLGNTDHTPSPTDSTSPTSTHDTNSTPNLPESASQPQVEFTLWEVLATDLALNQTPPEALTAAYGITREQLAELRANPFFQKLYQSKVEEIEQTSRNPSEAAFVQKMRFIADKAAPFLLNRLTDNETSNRDFATLLQMVVKLARREPPPPTNDQTATIAVGPSVTFNITGVPGLDHLASAIAVNASAPTTLSAASPLREPIPATATTVPDHALTRADLRTPDPEPDDPTPDDATIPPPPLPSEDDLLVMGVL